MSKHYANLRIAHFGPLENVTKEAENKVYTACPISTPGVQVKPDSVLHVMEPVLAAQTLRLTRTYTAGAAVFKSNHRQVWRKNVVVPQHNQRQSRKNSTPWYIKVFFILLLIIILAAFLVSVIFAAKWIFAFSIAGVYRSMLFLLAVVILVLIFRYFLHMYTVWLRRVAK